MSKRDEVIAEAREAPGMFDKWPADRDAGMSRDEVDAFRADMLLAARVALRIGDLAVGPEAAAERATWALDERQSVWDGHYRKRPAEWRDEYSAVLAYLAATALDAVMSIDDQRKLDGRTFYEAEPA